MENDKELLEKLDTVLTNREADLPESDDEDTRAMLEFARKMVSLGETPSKEFADNLKASLVYRLAEEEKKDTSGNMELEYWGVHRRKMWQGTMAAVIVVSVLIVILLVILLLNR